MAFRLQLSNNNFGDNEKMNTGDIDTLETEAEKAITKLAELAIEHNKDAIEWRRRYNELVSNLSKLCLYDRDIEYKPTSKTNGEDLRLRTLKLLDDIFNSAALLGSGQAEPELAGRLERLIAEIA